MTKNETKKGLMILNGFCLVNAPDFTIKESANQIIEAWHIFLKDYTYQQFEIAIMLFVKNNRYFPTISEILKEIPVPNKYLNPGYAFNIFMTKTLDPQNISHNLIKKAAHDSGYQKHYLMQLDPQTKERYVRPKIEKRYRELIELEEKRDNYKLIIREQKLLEKKGA